MSNHQSSDSLSSPDEDSDSVVDGDDWVVIVDGSSAIEPQSHDAGADSSSCSGMFDYDSCQYLDAILDMADD